MTKPVAVLHPVAGILTTLSFFTLFAGDAWRDLIGWDGYTVLAAVLAIGNIVWLVIARPHLSFRRWPKMLLVLVGLAIASIAWAHYVGVSGPGGHVDVLLGVLAMLGAGLVAIAAGLILTPRQLIKVLGNALRWIIGLSMLFELYVAVIVRHPVLPVARIAGVDYTQKHLPVPFYWSRGLLFHGGQIQGIVGNGDLLAMVVLVGLIVFAIQRADGMSRPFWGTFWIVLSGIELVLARSSTVWVATVATAVMFGFAMWARHIGQQGRGKLYVTGIIVVAATVGGILAAWDSFTALFHKTPTLTGRTDIWAQVIPLAKEHTWFGWGWLGYWVPWAKPFDGLAIRNGVEYLQAHNAWIDIWLQLGIVGVVVLGLLALTTLGRAWFLAVDRPVTDATTTQPFTALALLPLLVFTAQLVQSVAESRMLIESGFAMLVLWSVTTKAQRP